MSNGKIRLMAVVLTVVAWCAWSTPTAAADWVVRGRGFGHGVGMSQYGAYGYAKHGRNYRWILGHYYRHTKVRRAHSRALHVLLGTVRRSVPFTHARRACGKRVHHDRTYKFSRRGSRVILRSHHGRRIKRCGRSGSTSGGGSIRIFGDRDYRGDLTADSSGDHLLVINDVGLDPYARGVVPNEMPSSWPAQALRAQAVAARSYALATRHSGKFDLYDDTRSQVYAGKDSETRPTDRAVRRTARRVVVHRGNVATTFFFSSSGGRTESVQFAFLGSSPTPYLKSVRDRYDGVSPDHRWKLHFTQRQMSSHLAGLYSGRLRRIRITKTGDSPRIVRARVVGSHGGSRVSGPMLQARLGARSTWMRFGRR